MLLVYTGYKPRSHDIEALAAQTAPMHEALQGALPRTEGEDARLFDLLKRAYIEARYSKSYHITLDELAALRRHVLDLAERVRRACADKLATITEDGLSALKRRAQHADAEEWWSFDHSAASSEDHARVRE